MRKQRHTHVRSTAALAALVLLYAGSAAAQDVCIAAPNSAPGPGTDGAPKWLAADTHGGTINHWMNDIRWSDAALDHLGGIDDEDATYRVVFDGDYLLVSIQANKLQNDKVPNVEDRVYFAVGHELSDKAVAVAITLKAPSTTTAANSPTQAKLAETYIKDSQARVCVGGTVPGKTCTANTDCPNSPSSTGTCPNAWRSISIDDPLSAPLPSWLDAPAVWVNEATSGRICVNDTDTTAANKNNKPCTDANGDGQAEPSGACGATGVCVLTDPSRAIWGANFKIKITGTGGVGLPTADPLRMFVGARMIAKPMGMIVFKRLPEGAKTAVASDSLFDTSANDPEAALVPKAMSTWGLSNPPGVACNGASLDIAKMGHQTAAGNFDVVDLNVSATSDNTLVATAICPDNNCGSSSLNAKFRIANWGSNFGDLGWSPLVDKGGNSLIPIGINQHFTFNCPANVAGLSTCGLLNTGLNPPKNGYYHQCMAVDIAPARNSTVKVGSGSEFVNTRFEMASTIQRVATIDVRGLQAFTGNTNARNIYLFVTRKNMPAPTSKSLYLPRNEMLADRLDAIGMYSCDSANPAVSCVALDGAVGLCAYQCSAAGFCNEGDAKVDVSGSCYCAAGGESADVCYAGQPDARDPKNKPTVDARIERTWPTYSVLAYYDTGRTVKVGANTYKLVKTMSDFGMYVDHVGAHHGFTDSLAGLNGLAVTKVATDVYRISVPNEKAVTMNVTVTAQEDSSVVPLTVISGAATAFGVFGSVEIVGVSPVVNPIDLRKATVRLDRLMSENGRELVHNLGAPRTLQPLPGALPTIATFLNTTGVDVAMDVLDLPLIGRLTTTTAAGAAVDIPNGCPFAVGTAKLSTSFSINDTVNPVFATEAINDWACIPFVGMFAL